MHLDFEVQRCTRRCAATDRALAPGDVCYSVLEINGAEVIRTDFCSDGWNGAPQAAFGWWKSRIPEPTAKKIRLAPNDVLLELFDQLAQRREQQDLRYVLTLLLVRRRVLRVDVANGELRERSSANSNGNEFETMVVFCPKRDASYEVTVNMPSGKRIDEIQQQLSELLIADAE
jgi:hypothetical protein